ncbi:MAG: aspartyl/glutamyl-tRNA amidotransferase subunit C [Microgenomates group bacterium]|nr:aspartyl/glutamyl-tRNA amidotransferase subunit C [Microgenomates group bacterium]
MTKKTRLKIEQILHLADLAGVKLTEAEVKKYQDQLSQTIEYVSNLKNYHVGKAKITYQTTNLSNIFFPDGEKNQRAFSISEALLNAKNKKDNFFKTKKIL